MIKMCGQNMDAYDVLIQTEPGGGWRREQPTWRLCGSTADSDYFQNDSRWQFQSMQVE